MFARTAKFQIIPGKSEGMIQGYHESVKLLHTQKGFRQAILLLEPGADSGFSVTLWDSQVDFEASHTPAYAEKARPLVAPFQTALPTYTKYDVAVCAFASPEK